MNKPLRPISPMRRWPHYLMMVNRVVWLLLGLFILSDRKDWLGIAVVFAIIAQNGLAVANSFPARTKPYVVLSTLSIVSGVVATSACALYFIR
jgi:hypothetical protein